MLYKECKQQLSVVPVSAARHTPAHLVSFSEDRDEVNSAGSLSPTQEEL